MAVEEGQKAPDFTLLDSDRQARTLGEFRGKNVVLAFFPGAFTGGCTTEACALRDNAEKYNSLNGQVVGISVDSPIAQKGWAQANNINFPLLSDHQRRVIQDYGVEVPNFLGMEGYTAANRAVFVLDKEGTVRYKWVGTPQGQPDFGAVEAALNNLK
jgi:peroxiredoxin